MERDPLHGPDPGRHLRAARRGPRPDRLARPARRPSGSRLREGTGEEGTGLVPRDDDRFWRGAGTVYVNADDPAILVPKRVGIGWTVNFGNPRSLVVAALVLAVAVGAAVVQAVR